MKKLVVILLVIISVVFVFSGCGNSEKQDENGADEASYVEINGDSVTFIDGRGEEVTLNKNPQKVISLYNSYLDLWVSAGGSDRVVGRIETRGDVSESVKDVEIVGSMTSPNVEKIISMQPDLVILRHDMKGQKNIIPILEENNISFAALEYNNFDDYMKILQLFTTLTDKDDFYQKNGVKIKEEIDEIINKVPEDEKPSVLILFGTSKGVSVRLPNSMVGDMVGDLGAFNIAYDASLSDEEMEVFSMEKVLERDPDYVLVQTMGDIEKAKERIKEDIEENPAWASLTAVKEGRYIFLDKDLYLYKPNERYAEAYEGLAKILYPQYK